MFDGEAVIGLFGRDHRRQVHDGVFFYVPLPRMPVRYYRSGHEFDVPAEQVVQGFLTSIVGSGGAYLLSVW